MRQALGIAVFAGMLGVTAFGIFLTPVFFLVIQRVAGRKRRGDHAPPPGKTTAITDKPTA
jgi:hypothetical protein